MQPAMAGFIEDGLLDKHIRRGRRVYGERRDFLTEALGSGALADCLQARAVSAGLHITAVLWGGPGEDEVLQAEARHGIATSGLRDCFGTRPAQPGILTGFGRISAADLPAAVRALSGYSPPEHARATWR